MTEITVNEKVLKVYTNKNSSIFREGAAMAYEHIHENEQYGVLYDDFNANDEVREKWIKEYPNMTIYKVAKRGKTLQMDSKISFHRKMSLSEYTPESYLTLNEIRDKEAIYFVKKNGSTGGRGVQAYKFSDLSSVNIQDCVIQKSMSNPDLFEKKRYKIRQLVVIHNKEVYLHEDSWTSYSNENFDTSEVLIREKNVIYQTTKTPFMLSKNLDNFELIYKNITKAVCEFTQYYRGEINDIGVDEFSILGFDFVVDKDKCVHIIEINHRSNYSHPKHVSDVCDIGCIRDLIIMLTNKSINGTKLVKCN